MGRKLPIIGALIWVPIGIGIAIVAILIGSGYGDQAEGSRGLYLNSSKVLILIVTGIAAPIVAAVIYFLIGRNEERQSCGLMNDTVGKNLVDVYTDFLVRTEVKRWSVLKLNSPAGRNLKGQRDLVLLNGCEAFTPKTLACADQVHGSFERTIFRQGSKSRRGTTLRYADRFMKTSKILMIELGYKGLIFGRKNRERKELLKGLRKELENHLAKPGGVKRRQFRKRVTTRL